MSGLTCHLKLFLPWILSSLLCLLCVLLQPVSGEGEVPWQNCGLDIGLTCSCVALCVLDLSSAAPGQPANLCTLSADDSA